MHTDLFLCTKVSSHGGELAMPSRPPVKSLAAVHEPHMTGDDSVVCMTDLSLMVHACGRHFPSYGFPREAAYWIYSLQFLTAEGFFMCLSPLSEKAEGPIHDLQHFYSIKIAFHFSSMKMHRVNVVKETRFACISYFWIYPHPPPLPPKTTGLHA